MGVFYILGDAPPSYEVMPHLEFHVNDTTTTHNNNKTGH